MYNQTLSQFSLVVVEVDQMDYVFVLKADARPLTKIRPIHGSGWVSFGLNLDLTRQHRMEGGGTRNRPSEKSVGSVSSDG